MIDTHAHLDFPQYDGDREEVIQSGFEHGLEAIVNIGTDLETSRRSLDLASRYENIFAAVGVHPHDAKAVPPDYLDQLRKMATGSPDSKKKVVAIGEIGLDYYRDMSPRDIQRKIFKEQLDLARTLDLPVVVHIREAMDDSLRILRDSGVKRGILHSFPGDSAQAKIGIDMGFSISFAGPITYPKSTRAEVAASLPLSRIVAETDSPYLTPQAFRGKRNRPEYVRYVIEKLAEVFAPYTFDDIERITSINARLLFGLPIDKSPRYVYKIRRSLYINLTNRCTNNCQFCIRKGKRGGIVGGHYLFLSSEPTVADVIDGVNSQRDFDEVVFCGLGEPTLRLKELLEIATILKKKGHKIRLDTNGQGSLINRTDVPAKIVGLIDTVSVSLNTPDAATYVKLCKPDRGEEAYQAMLKFIKDCVDLKIPAEVSVVDLPEVDIEASRQLAIELGATFRIRRFVPGE